MRILYLTRSYTPHDRRFLEAISAAGNQVLFLRLENEARASERRPLPTGVQEMAWSGGNGPWKVWPPGKAVKALRRLLRDSRPHLVHAGPMQQGAFLAARAGFRPLVSMSWGSDMLLGARRGLGRWVARWTLHRSTLFLCDCRAVARVAEELGMPSERIRIFPWGVDLEHFHPAGSSPLRARLGWEEAFVLLSTRNWEPIYGLGTLAEGFVRAARVEPSLRLLMLGGGSLEGQIKATLAQAGMLERVHFAGLVGFAELPAYYHTADLYISASHSDGTSISLLEAMACGLPALVTDIPGNREWVTPGRNGWLFPPGDARALAQAILRAKGEPRLLEAMGAAARVIAEGRADWRRNQEELLHAYKLAMVLEGGPADER